MILRFSAAAVRHRRKLLLTALVVVVLATVRAVHSPDEPTGAIVTMLSAAAVALLVAVVVGVAFRLRADGAGFEVERSLSSVRPKRITAPPRAMAPMIGCSRKMKPR